MNDKILIYVEDPGACNYVRQLPENLGKYNINAELTCSGAAVTYLEARQTAFKNLDISVTAAELLDQYMPDLVLVGTSEEPDSLALKLIDECANRNIVSVAVIDMEANADRRFRGHSNSSLAHIPGWLLVPDNSCKLAYEDLGFSSHNIFVVGHPHFDHVRKIGAALKNDAEGLKEKIIGALTPDRLVITFIAEGYDRLNKQASLRGADYTLHGRGRSDFRTAIVLEELIDTLAKICPKPYLVLRLHPKMSQEDLAEYTNEIDYLSWKEDPLELIAVSDLVVGMSSMLLQEAAIMGKSTLAILPRVIEKQWLPATANDYTPTINTRAQLREIISNFSKKPDVLKPQKDLFFLTNSLDRVITTLIDILKNGKSREVPLERSK